MFVLIFFFGGGEVLGIFTYLAILKCITGNVVSLFTGNSTKTHIVAFGC